MVTPPATLPRMNASMSGVSECCLGGPVWTALSPKLGGWESFIVATVRSPDDIANAANGLSPSGVNGGESPGDFVRSSKSVEAVLEGVIDGSSISFRRGVLGEMLIAFPDEPPGLSPELGDTADIDNCDMVTS